MPLTDEHKAAIQTLKSIPAEDAEEFAGELLKEAQPLSHHISRKGYVDAEGRWKPKAEAAEAKLSEAEQRADQAEEKLRKGVSSEDRDALNREWQEKYDRDTTSLAAERDAEKQGRVQEREARKLADLKAELTGLDPEYVAFKAASAVQRLQYKDDNTLELYEPGTTIPVAVPAGQSPFKVLAEEIRKAAPPVAILSNADSGSGREGGSGGATGVTSQQIEQEKRQSGAYTI